MARLYVTRTAGLSNQAT